ncbi:amino acid adenylation domain-containing protein [Streptomyces lydicus]|uniref:non-ribosomal peptide synthetase n=1 Tax=Streptomyces lydicus TaxID=47763 RepID=UPI0036F8E5BD
MLPVSFAQRRLWFLDRLQDTRAAYNLPTALRLSGQLDVAALRGALADLVERHEPLRTFFPETEGEPHQCILDRGAAVPELPVIAVREDSLDIALLSAIAEPFALGEQPPFRSTLFQMGPEDFVLLLVVHHIASDGWSAAPLIRDLSAAYRARSAGLMPPWGELPVQYADYSLWQREFLGDANDPKSVHARQAAHWRDALAGAPEVLALPVDRPRPAVASHRGARVPFHCSAELYRGLAEVAREHQCTPFMALHAALAVLLARLGAGTDIPIGSVVSGRTEQELNDLVGFFVNTVVLRTDLSGDPSFRDVLERTRRADSSCYANQELPFDLLVEAVNPPRSMSYHPLFQVMLAFEGHSQERPDFGHVRADPYQVGSPPAAKVDLTFQLLERQDEHGFSMDISGYLDYATDLFDANTAEAICSRLVRVIRSVVADPDLPIGEVDLLTPDERHQILVEWNATDRQLPVTTLTEALSAQAARTPDAAAVVSGELTLSYAQLHAHAERLAWHLADAGATLGGVVAVALPRSVDLVVSLLAIHKVGCAYLPLDPEHPAERIAHVLRDARPAFVLTDRATRDALPVEEARIVLVDALAHRPERADSPTVFGISPDHPAYVIYTSGSTGRPKGVVVSHAAIDNRLRWMQGAYPLTAGDRVLQKTPCGFDVSVWELFWPLREGAVLVLAPPGEHRDPARLVRTIHEQRVTVVHFVPSLLELFLAEAEAEVTACTGLRRVFCSGEALARETAQKFHRVLPGVALENLYGPTEAAVDVTYHSCRAGETGAVPIGRPVWNTRTYVLDEALRPCSPGSPGELYLSGGQLAIGYLGQQALTASRFVANPYGPPGSRMYRTGDIVRWQSDGTLDYLGREDLQVKLHGQRLELGEIESLLAADDTVGAACAVVRTDSPGEHRIVAYVTPAHDPHADGADFGRPDPAQLRDRLAIRLPVYMVPTVVIVLERFPLTFNGKLDRAALPPPQVPAVRPGRAPGTPQEEMIARIVADLLGLETVGMDDDFFGLGGHSMLAIRLAGRMRQALGTDVPVQAVFRWPTPAALARHLAAPIAATQEDGTAPLLPLRPQGKGQPLFFVHPGAGLSWCYFRLLEYIDTDRPIYGIQARGLAGDPDEWQLPHSVEEMADDYVSQIKEVQAEGPYHLIGWSFGGQVAHAMATRLQKAGERVGLLVALDSYPVAPDAAPQEADEKELLQAALRNLFDGSQGYTPAKTVLDDATVHEVCERFAPLADASPQRVRSTVRVGMNNVRLMERFVPDRFDGDLTLLTARSDTGQGDRPDHGWHGFVSGRVTVLPVDCGHYEMFTTGVATIGRLLSPVLAVPTSRQAGPREEPT